MLTFPPPFKDLCPYKYEALCENKKNNLIGKKKLKKIEKIVVKN